MQDVEASFVGEGGSVGHSLSPKIPMQRFRAGRKKCDECAGYILTSSRWILPVIHALPGAVIMLISLRTPNSGR